METTDAEIAAVNAAPRAIVCLTTPWSVYPRVAAADLTKAADRLRELGLALETFLLDEDSEPCRKWLGTLGLPAPYDGTGFPQGWGTLIWLEHGRMVWWSGHGNEERPIGIIERTKLLWMKSEPRVS